MTSGVRSYLPSILLYAVGLVLLLQGSAVAAWTAGATMAFAAVASLKRVRLQRVVVVEALPALLVLALLALAPGAAASPGVASHFDLIVGKEHTLAFGSLGNPSRFDLELEEWADLNGDGDFADAGEANVRVSLTDTTTCAGIQAHFSCILQDNSQHLFIVWKANSSFQQVDRNYTLTITWENAIGTVQDRAVAGFRFRNDSAVHQGLTTRGTVQAEAVQTRTLQNATTQNVIETVQATVIDQGKQGRNRTHILFVADSEDLNYVVHIPSAATQLSMRVYSLDGNGGPDDVQETLEVSLNNAPKCSAQGVPGSHFDCQVDKPEAGLFTLLWKNDSSIHVPGNYSFVMEFKNIMNDILEWRLLAVRVTGFNATQGGGGGDSIPHSAFTTDCHGTGADLCVNGHQPNALLDNSGILAALVIVPLIWAWLVHHPNTGPRVVGVIISAAYGWFVLTQGADFGAGGIPVGALLFLGAVAMLVFGVMRVFMADPLEDRWNLARV